MKNIFKLSIAVILAGLAGVLNAFYLSQSQSFVEIRTKIKQGDPIVAEKLQRLKVPDTQGALKKSLVPWEDRNLLLQLQATRDYSPGDVVLQRDVAEMVDQAARKTELLRFRVIAVGDRFKRIAGSESFSGSSNIGSTVTIAVKQPTLPNGEFDVTDESGRIARRMVNVVTRRITGKDPLPEDRILGVAVFPRATQLDTPGKVKAAPGGGPLTVSSDDGKSIQVEQPAKDEMALTIPLEGVESVPAVILVGGEIGFYMSPEYPH